MTLENLVPWRARPNFRFDATSAVLAGLYSGAIFPYVGFIARDYLGATSGQIGLMAAAPFVGNLLAMPLTHALTRTNQVRSVATALALARLIMVTASIWSGSAAFAWTVFFVQCIAALPGPTGAAVIRRIYPREFIGRLLSYSRTGLAAGSIVSTLVAGYLIDRYSWRWVFAAAAPMGFIALLLYSRIRIPPDPDPVQEDDNIRQFVAGSLRLLVENRSFLWFAAAVSVYGFGNLMIVPVVTIYQVDVLHFRARDIGVLTNVIQITWMFSYVFWSRYIDRVSPLKIVTLNTLLCALVPLNYILATTWWMLLPMAVISGIVSAGIDLSYFNSVMHFSTPETVSQYQSVHSLLLGIRGVTAPMIGAALIQSVHADPGGLRVLLGAGMALILVGTALQWWGIRRHGAHPAHVAA